MEYPYGHNHHPHHHHHRRPEEDENPEDLYPPPPPPFSGHASPYPPPPFAGNDYPPPPFAGHDYSPPPFAGHDYPPPPFAGNDYPPPPFAGHDSPPPPFARHDSPYPPPGHQPSFGGYQAPPHNYYPGGPPPVVHHVSHEGGGFGHHGPTPDHEFGGGGGGSHVHHVAHESGGSGNRNQPTFRIYTKADENYSLSIRDGNVVLARADHTDPYQRWIKDLRYSTKVKDEESCPSFALINKVTGEAIKHPIGATHPVRLTRYNPDYLDESVLWAESKSLGDGFRCIRMVNNIRLNFDAFHGDEDHGGVHDGTTVVLWEWLKGKNQRWKIVPY